MTEDLLTRIQGQLQERMAQLRDAVEERDRLQIDLAALDADHTASEPDPQPVAHNLLRLPVRREPARARAVVSSKVARLMLAPRRPSLERSGTARVSKRAAASLRVSGDASEAQTESNERAAVTLRASGDASDAQTESYEHAI
jgi:hypothetical protein